VPLWLLVHLGAMAPDALDRDWHVHEMLFGYVAAVAAGFLLTAVPNWTGRLPVTGPPLILLFGLWAAGRAAMLLVHQLGPWAAALDAAFLVVFAGVVWREVLAGRNWRNLPVCALASLLALANIGFHLRVLAPQAGPIGERAALGAVAVLIALIGGRVTPSFTRNWMAQSRGSPEPAPADRFDLAALLLAVAGVAAWIVAPDHGASGLALCFGGVCALARLSRWRTRQVLVEPLVWSLHAGYAWLGVGLILLGASVLFPELIPRSAGIHALTAGAAGVMTLAMMTRATLGHTGRARIADGATTALYAGANLAAVLRVAAPFAGQAQVTLLVLAGLAWTLTFAGFALVYGPMLLRPRMGATA
jgi:uncharacterized protein involved in response to NO